jgi:hypothetical protein
MAVAPGHAHPPKIKILHHDKFLAPIKLVPRHCASAHNKHSAPRQFTGFDQTCIATRVSSIKTCTRMAKTTPYPPCTVTAFWLKNQDRDRCLRRATPTKLYRRAVMGKFSPENEITINKRKPLVKKFWI